MKRRALLIGGTGFVGSHLVPYFHHSYDVTATGHTIDIRDENQIQDLVALTMPDIVINLASITTVRESFENQEETYKIGFFGTLNVLRALKKTGFKGRMLQVGSSEVYGFPRPEQLPISETEPLRPMSPYAVNKAACEALCYQWSQTESFDVLMTRSFTHVGPGQSDRFAIASFARQIVQIKQGHKEAVLHVGALDATRDYTDVRDVVSAYDSILQKGINGNVYNVCSGTERSTHLVLSKLLEISGVKASIEQDTSRMRDSEQRRLCGDNKKVVRDTGWSPGISINETLSDMLNYLGKNCYT